MKSRDGLYLLVSSNMLESSASLATRHQVEGIA